MSGDSRDYAVMTTPVTSAQVPDRLVCHQNAASGQHLLDHAKAQWEPKYSHTA
jgi:hypothetical protein